MPELGRYTFEVLLAYGGSLALLAALIGGSIWQARRVARDLAQIEGQARKPKMVEPKA